MATRTATLRTILEAVSDVGELPDQKLDVSAALDGYTDFTVRSVPLAAAAADQAFTFTGVIAVVIASRDNPFKLRLAAGETLLANLKLFIAWAKDEATAIKTTSFLLTGNGSNTANLDMWLIEKPV